MDKINKYTNIELEIAYNLGAEAYKIGNQQEDNPYDFNTEKELHYKWDEGFTESEEEEDADEENEQN